ncbi:MAG: hypothetical protein IPI23_10185 [Bacteroidetes bacterium]|nr:hypothetical protein [Bacteroidota bacterium]
MKPKPTERCGLSRDAGLHKIIGKFNETADFTDLGAATGTGSVDVLLTMTQPSRTLEHLLL